MKHLRDFKLFESADEINELLQNIKDILQDLIDIGWIVSVRYIPKRWSNTYNSDFITVDIRKNRNESCSRYPIGSEFTLSKISDYTLRLVDFLQNEIVDTSVSICKADKTKFYKSETHIDGVRKFNVGLWEERSSLDPQSNEEILGIKFNFSLNGENLDKFNI
jgi:hypothetical protein